MFLSACYKQLTNLIHTSIPCLGYKYAIVTIGNVVVLQKKIKRNRKASQHR